MNDPNISSKDIYRAGRNYMANELGINSATGREMLDKQIAAVNPKTMAEMAVSRYFYSYGARRWNINEDAKSIVHQVIEEQVAAKMKSGADQYLDAYIQQSMDTLFGRRPVIQPVQKILHITQAAEIMFEQAANAVRAVTKPIAGDDVTVTVTSQGPSRTGVTACVFGLSKISGETLEDLAPRIGITPHSNMTWSNIPDNTFKTILSEHAVGFPVKEITTLNGWILCLGAKYPAGPEHEQEMN